MDYHYIVGVGTNDIRSSNPGELYLDSLFEFTEDDRERVNNCRLLSKDKLFPKSVDDSSIAFDCSHIIANFQGSLVRSRAQNTILLHYVSSSKLDRKFFEQWIKATPLEELKKAKIF